MSFEQQGFQREIGLLLKYARGSRRITQAELARQIGIGRANYASIESGRQRVPVDVLWRAAVVLKVQLTALVPESLRKA